MNNVDNVTNLVYATIEILVEMQNQDIPLAQREELLKAIDNLEEVRHLIYNFKNDYRKNIV